VLGLDANSNTQEESWQYNVIPQEESWQYNVISQEDSWQYNVIPQEVRWEVESLVTVCLVAGAAMVSLTTSCLGIVLQINVSITHISCLYSRENLPESVDLAGPQFPVPTVLHMVADFESFTNQVGASFLHCSENPLKFK
jgi:hypothetical protein